MPNIFTSQELKSLGTFVFLGLKIHFIFLTERDVTKIHLCVLDA